MNNAGNIFTKTVVVCIGFVCAGSLVYGQTYQWENLGSVGVEWGYPGTGTTTATFNQNTGSVVVGGSNPDAGLILDIAGSIGGSDYCSEIGDNCIGQVAAGSWSYYAGDDRLVTTDNTVQVAMGVVSPTQKLHVGGTILADSFLYSSDKNLKKNITPLNGLDIVSQLSGVRFDWKDTGESEVGVIAQEVEQVLPELVVTDTETGNKLVQYSNLVAPLIEAVNQQRLELESIEQDIAELKRSKK